MITAHIIPPEGDIAIVKRLSITWLYKRRRRTGWDRLATAIIVENLERGDTIVQIGTIVKTIPTESEVIFFATRGWRATVLPFI